MKKVAKEVVAGGGVVRSIHNHGIRLLPHRFKAKFPDKQGNRYFFQGRFISVYYDANPSTMRLVEQVLKMDEEVLRNTHLKARSTLDFVNLRPDRNPYVKRAMAQQEKQQQHHTATTTMATSGEPM
jgi:ribosomal protein S6